MRISGHREREMENPVEIYRSIVASNTLEESHGWRDSVAGRE